MFQQWRLKCKSVQWFRKKDKQVRTMHWHSSRLTAFIVCVKSKDSIYCVVRLSRAKYGQSSSWRAVDMPNLERELRFGAKPWAGALIWSQTSSGSAFEVQNLERERIRAQPSEVCYARCCRRLSWAKAWYLKCFRTSEGTVEQSRIFQIFNFQFKLVAQPNI